MKILITGSKGFVGKNLIAELKNRQYFDILEYDIDSDISLLDDYTKKCDFIFHLAGVNRPKNAEEFMEVNFGFTNTLLDLLKKNENKSPIMISSSIQAEEDNDYGRSKKAGEELLLNYGRETGASVLIYRFPNIFGKWCRPNYNSVIATFCFNITNNLPITVRDPNIVLNLVYIDDVVDELIKALRGLENRIGFFCKVSTEHFISLGEIVEILYSFKNSRLNLSVPELNNDFIRKLYGTYISYLPKNEFNYPLKMNSDERGSFTEIIRTIDRGQFSVNVVKPGMKKGNHWHHSKNEKFLVVCGKGLIQFRDINSDEIINYYVSGDKMEVVDIPPGYIHTITNIGDIDLITFMWASEIFNQDKADTFYTDIGGVK